MLANKNERECWEQGTSHRGETFEFDRIGGMSIGVVNPMARSVLEDDEPLILGSDSRDAERAGC